MTWNASVCLALLILLSTSTAQVGLAQDGGLANTLWRTQKETGWKTAATCKRSPTSVVAFTECTGDYDGLCGSVRALNPNDSQLRTTDLSKLTDSLNPYPELRSRKVIGIKIFANLRARGEMLVGDGYSPCRGEHGKICMRRIGKRQLEQWACLPGVGCHAKPGLFCTPKYVWTRVDGVPEGWVGN